MFIIGERKDTAESIANLRKYVNTLDPDLTIFAILTPFPGTQIFEEAKQAQPDLFSRVEIHGIDTPIEEISKRAVELATK